MTVILVAGFMLAVAAAFFVWVFKSMGRTGCRECRRDGLQRQFIIPILPGFRWFCSSCGNIFSSEEIDYYDESDQLISKEE